MPVNQLSPLFYRAQLPLTQCLALMAQLVNASIWCEFMPLPDDLGYVYTKNEPHIRTLIVAFHPLNLHILSSSRRLQETPQ